jgi:hypothetical protein
MADRSAREGGGTSVWVWVAVAVVALLLVGAGAFALTRPRVKSPNGGASETTAAAGSSSATPAAGDGSTPTNSVETTTVGLEGAGSITARIVMPTGTLNVSGGAPVSAAMSGEFQGVSLYPRVSYKVADGVGDLSLTQPADASNVAKTGVWTVKLAGDVESALSLTLGAGPADLALGDMDLKSLEVAAAAGAVTIDTTGGKITRLDGYVKAGSGKLSLTVPKDKPVRIDVAGKGSGQVTASGLNKGSDGVYRTAGSSGETADISFRIDRGSGPIELVAK